MVVADGAAWIVAGEVAVARRRWSTMSEISPMPVRLVVADHDGRIERKTMGEIS